MKESGRVLVQYGLNAPFNMHPLLLLKTTNKALPHTNPTNPTKPNTLPTKLPPSDKIFGGDVNPAVSACMFSLGKSNLPTFLTKVSAQLVGGIVAFVAFSRLSRHFSLAEFGGPALPKYATEDAIEVCVMNELTATALLLFTIFAVNWEVVFVPNSEVSLCRYCELMRKAAM